MQQDNTIHEILSRLPNRESELFSAVNQDVINLYQVKQALLLEQQYYEEHCRTLKTEYEKSKLQLQQLNETYSEQKLLNERIEKYLLRKTKLAELLQQEQTMENEKQRLELAKKQHISNL